MNLYLTLNIVMTSFYNNVLLLYNISLGFLKETERQDHIRFQELNLDEHRFWKAVYLIQFSDCLFDCEPVTCLCRVNRKLNRALLPNHLIHLHSLRRMQTVKIKKINRQTLENNRKNLPKFF